MCPWCCRLTRNTPTLAAIPIAQSTDPLSAYAPESLRTMSSQGYSFASTFDVAKDDSAQVTFCAGAALLFTVKD